MRAKPVRVLVVDDSAFARKVLSTILTAAGSVEVVGIARDGLDALERIAELKPDVVTLDLMMPHLDGLGVLKALPASESARIIVVSVSGADSELGVEALRHGAFDVVTKPTALATDRLYELKDDLVSKVLAAADARPRSHASLEWGAPALAPDFPAARPAPIPAQEPAPRTWKLAERRPRIATELVVLGTSTGGPQALARLLPKLPAGLAAPMVIALHIPEGYTLTLAQRLDDVSVLQVVEARDGMKLSAGLVVLAQGGMNLIIEKKGDGLFVRVARPNDDDLYRPSVDMLFESAVDACGAAVLGVVLTGMGDDGLRGSRAIHAAGGRVIAEAEESCVVYGMPRCIHEAGIAVSAPLLDDVSQEIVRQL